MGTFEGQSLKDSLPFVHYTCFAHLAQTLCVLCGKKHNS